MENAVLDEEKTLIKGKKHILSQFPNMLATLICVTIAIVVLSLSGGWINQICEAVVKAAMKQHSLSALETANETVEMLNKALPIVFKVIGYGLIIVPSLELLLGLLRLASTQLTLTDKRLFGKTGIKNVKKTDLQIAEITRIAVTTTFWGKIFKFDNIEIKGKHDVESVTYKGIANADSIRRAVGSHNNMI